MPDLTNRVALITGASGGLGDAVVEAFLSRGAMVVVVASSLKADGTRARFYAVETDLTKPEGARAAVAAAVEKAGKVDILVHVMGAFAGGKPVAETDDGTWGKMISLNLSAAFFMVRAVLPSMIGAGYGRIVAVGSRASVEPGANLSAYNVSKAGLNTLICTVALESKEHGITANVVMPSTIDTPANRESMPTADFTRWVKPSAIAEQIVWLSSDAASDISGALIPVYGRV
jgi:NAD(P)-dependent dehydrogenase (short-subunit alcohol dehydrogenase family)